jgi:hypothetical protein
MNQTSAWHRLRPAQKIGILAALVLPCVGGLAVIGAVSGDDPAPERTTAVQRLAEADVPVAPPSPIPSPSPSPSVVKRTVTKTEPIKFSSRRVKDNDLPKGEKEKRTAGVNGVRTKTWTVTVVDGQETGRKLLSSQVTRKPVTEVIAIGTYTEPEQNDCAAGYDPCVPVASDVDCAGGSGNGPAYVDGPIRVTGSDQYDLDRDGDGIACDS